MESPGNASTYAQGHIIHIQYIIEIQVMIHVHLPIEMVGAYLYI